ncbi:MAG: membrane protein insertase YidC [Holosporaceae bacterium]|jgi:YidC/Oxa1 family membrane protein insertase|nr:membrane protein insertase YidC [Holosporaceae bacterium]
MEEEKRNLLLFTIISIIIMICYPLYMGMRSADHGSPVINSTNGANDAQFLANRFVDHKVSAIIKKTPPAAAIKQIKLDSASLRGSLCTKGLNINKIFLKKYMRDPYTANPNGVFHTGDAVGTAEFAAFKNLASIFGDANGKYYAKLEWVSPDKTLLLPSEETCWKIDSPDDSLPLSEKSPLLLSWNNGDGLRFERRISIDEHYVMTIVDSVKNYGDHNVSLKLTTVICREFDREESNNTFNFYEGPIGYFNGKLEEISYDDVVKKKNIEHKSTGGWFGITDKYWLVAFIPDQKNNSSVSYGHFQYSNKNLYRIEGGGDFITVAASGKMTQTNQLFVGAKELKILDMYEKKLGVAHFDLAIDFGCLYILTKPLLYALAFLKDLVGNMGVGILLLTLLIKLLLLPLAHKSYKSMNRLKEIQPKIQALQKKYADDKVKLGQELSAIYQREGISPIGGCLPTLLQSPVLFALYKVLYISIEMRQASFFGWIHDLSLPDPVSLFNLFGLIPIALPSFLNIGIWPMLMGLSMFWQQKIGPSSPDATQAKMMLFLMPVMFTCMFAQLPSGLVIYWTFSNVLSIGQQYIVNRSNRR